MVNLSKMKKEKIYFYNGEIKEELKIPQSFFPKDKKNNMWAYCYVEYICVDESENEKKFALNLYYYNNYNEENLFQFDDMHVILMTRKQVISLVNKVYNKLNTKRINGILNYTSNEVIITEDCSEINSILQMFIFTKDGIDIKEKYRIFKTMKQKYFDLKRELESSNRLNCSILAKFHEKIECKYKNNNYSKCYLRVYNVGQANFSTLYTDENTNPDVIFDFGCDSKHFSDITYEIKNIGSDGYVVISHFHQDHFNLYRIAPNDFFKRSFILHSIPEALNASAAFLDRILINAANIFIIKDDTIKLEANYINFDFFKVGQGLRNLHMNGEQNALENIHSLVSIIKIGGAEAILPGDALEWEFPLNANHHFKFAYLSHHGCKTMTDKVLPYKVDISFLPTSDPGQKKYYHPQLSHLSKYNTVFRFGGDNSIMFNNRKKISDNKTLKIKSKYLDIYF